MVVSLGTAGTNYVYVYPKTKVQEIVAEFFSIGACGVIVNLGQKVWSDLIFFGLNLSMSPRLRMATIDSSFDSALLKYCRYTPISTWYSSPKPSIFCVSPLAR